MRGFRVDKESRSLIRIKVEDGATCESRPLSGLRRVIIDDTAPPGHAAQAASLHQQGFLEGAMRIVLVMNPPERIVVCKAELGSAILALWSVAASGAEVVYRSELPVGSADSSHLDYAEKLIQRLRVKLRGDDDEPLTMASIEKFIADERSSRDSWGTVASLAVRFLAESPKVLGIIINDILLKRASADPDPAVIAKGLAAVVHAVLPSSAPANVVPAACALVTSVISDERLKANLPTAITEELIRWCTELSASYHQREATLLAERLLFDTPIAAGIPIAEIRATFVSNCAEFSANRKGVASRGQLGIAASDPTESLRELSIVKRATTTTSDESRSPRQLRVGVLSIDKSPLLRIESNEGFIEVLNDMPNVSTVVATHRVSRSAGSGGHWHFEVVLLTPGSIRIGWAAVDAAIDPSSGIGACTSTWAFDGSSGIIIHASEQSDFGSLAMRWRRGDVVRCDYDPDSLSISFGLNGAPLRQAFDSIPKAVAEKGLRPAVSLGSGQACAVNFGAAPFMFQGSSQLTMETNTERCTKAWAVTASATGTSPKTQPQLIGAPAATSKQSSQEELCLSCRVENVDCTLACSHRVLCTSCAKSYSLCPVCGSVVKIV